MPLHLDETKFKRIALSIPRARVNEFLGELWDEFSRAIGRVSCSQNYLETDDPEVYEFCACWSDRDLPFIAELSFFNHTSKGLTHVLVAVLDYETREISEDFEGKIRSAIIKVAQSSSKQPAGRTAFLMVPFHAGAKLSGDYKLLSSEIILRKPREEDEEVDGYMVFPLVASNEEERVFEGSNSALNLAAALSVITQRHFVVSVNFPWRILTPQLFQSILNESDCQSQWIDDSGFTDQKETKEIINLNDPTRMIIEECDCITHGKLSLPRRADQIVNLILNNDRYSQSCRRYHEGIDLRKKMDRKMNAIHIISYELIAYVAAIEALLDHRKEKIDLSCPSCGELVSRDEWKISDRFKKFIAEYSDGNEFLKRLFSKVYEDRSKFVHTGTSLHNYLAFRSNRPLILMGKSRLGDFPDYYFNIHEYTGVIVRKFFYMQLPPESMVSSSTN